MDPYIDPDRLDRSSPFYKQKMDNLQRGNTAYDARAAEVSALPVKITLQTTDVCNLDWPSLDKVDRLVTVLSPLRDSFFRSRWG